MPPSTRRFSTAPLQQVADSLAQQAPPALDALLQKLFVIDGQIHRDFTTVKAQLATAEACLQQQTDRGHHLATTCAEQAALIASLQHQLRQSPAAPRPASPKRPASPLGKKRNAAPPRTVCTCKENRDENIPPDAADHLPTCELKRAVLKDMSPAALCELLEAREEAYRVQQSLVERLKGDNKELKQTYDKLWGRYQDVRSCKDVATHRSSQVDQKIEHLSLRVQQAGQAVCNVVSQVEEKLQLTAADVQSFRQSIRDIDTPADVHQSGPHQNEPLMSGHPSRARDATGTTRKTDEQDRVSVAMSETDDIVKENDRFNLAGQELMRRLAQQKEAHERLRSTVVELTQELERIEPEHVDQGKKNREQLEAAEIHLDKSQAELKQKNFEIEELKKQLKKVLAEYEAVKIAHSYSNAELSKIRATNRAKTKYDRHVNGAENVHHHHHRKNYFR